MTTRILQTAAAVAVCAMAGSAWAAVELPALQLDKTQTTVSGLSSGGYMAVQLHVAFPRCLPRGGRGGGRAVLCAEGSVANATGRCMASPCDAFPPARWWHHQHLGKPGVVDPVSPAKLQVYLFSGSVDSVVKTGAMDALKTLHNSFVPAANVVYKRTSRPSTPGDRRLRQRLLGQGARPTSTTATSTWLNCHAGSTCTGRSTRAARSPAREQLCREFKAKQLHQQPRHGQQWLGLHAAGLPGGATCRLHVALHGCKQNVSDVRQQFVRNTGFNRWAGNQQHRGAVPADQHRRHQQLLGLGGVTTVPTTPKTGPQMAAIKAMVDRLGVVAATSDGAAACAHGRERLGRHRQRHGPGLEQRGRGRWLPRVPPTATKVNALTVYGTSYRHRPAASTTYQWTVRAVDAQGVEGRRLGPVSGTTLAASGGESPPAPPPALRPHLGGPGPRYGFAYANGSGQGMGWWNLHHHHAEKPAQLLRDRHLPGAHRGLLGAGNTQGTRL